MPPMARLGDLPKLFRSVGVWAFARRVWNQTNEDSLFTWASALAYAWLFAIFPFMLFLLALIPYLPQEPRKETYVDIRNFLNNWFPREASQLLEKNIRAAVTGLRHEPKTIVLCTGLLAALWAASSGMAATMSALDRCYELHRGRPFYRQRALAILMTIMVMVLLVAVACLLPLGGVARVWLVEQRLLPDSPRVLVLFNVARWLIAVVVIFSILALIYYKGPSVKHRFNWITPGAVFCVTVWVGLGLVFRFYIDHFGGKGYDQMYGALGGVAILLLLFYLDGLVLLIGAEINSEIDFEVLKIRRGTRDFRLAEDVEAAAPTAI